MVKFSPLGTHFAVLYPKKVEIYSLTLKLLKTISGTARFNTILFATVPVGEDEEMEALCIGTEKGQVEVYSIEIAEPTEEDEESEDEEDDEGIKQREENGAEVERIGTFVGHTNRSVHARTCYHCCKLTYRVKSISSLSYTTPATDEHPAKRLVIVSSVSTDGFINLYELTALLASTADQQPLASYDTKGSRLTVCCLAEGKKAGQLVKAAVNGSDALAGADEESDEAEDSAEDDEEEEDIYGSSEGDDDDGDEDDGMEVEFEDDEEEMEGEEEEEE